MNDSIMITGVGAVIGQGIVKSLLNENLQFRLVGIDANSFSVGFQWTDVSYTVPRTDDPLWISSIVEICNKEKVVLILPGIEQDVKALLQNRDTLIKNTRAFPLLNSSEAMRVGFDKWELCCFAKQYAVKVPLTGLVNNINTDFISNVSYPLLLKPRKGMAGKGIYRVENREDLDYWIRRIQVSDYILQQYIRDDNDEYTVSIFGFHDGILTEPFALKRRLNYGSTFEAETIYEPNLSEKVSRIARKLNIVGPTNFQFKKVGDDHFLLEINPRFSSSTSIKSAFGFNEPLMAVKSFILRQSKVRLELKRGRCSRYLADSIIYESGNELKRSRKFLGLNVLQKEPEKRL